MLREETAKLLMMIQGAYPNYKPDNKTITINTWNLALSDIQFDLAQKAFLAYLSIRILSPEICCGVTKK